MGYAHGRNIAHRDIKPENVVFCTKDKDDAYVKVIDWGLGACWTNSKMSTAVGSMTYAAPEVLTSGGYAEYTSACDVWSLGVMTYVMLCGKPPFWGSQKQHLAKATQEKYIITGPPWDAITDQAKDFVRILLRCDPAKRPMMDSVVTHTWLLKQERPCDVQTQSQVLLNMFRFSQASTFTKVCAAAVARQLDHTHLRSIHRVFRKLDQNGDGVLSLNEISTGFKNICGDESQEYQRVLETFRCLDLDGSQVIDYTEFCAAGLGQHGASQEEAIWAAFKTFDLNNDYKISKDELQKVLASVDMQNTWSAQVCEDVAQKVLEKFDTNGDGAIDFEEWKVLMRESWNQHVQVDQDDLLLPVSQNELNQQFDAVRCWAYALLQAHSNLS